LGQLLEAHLGLLTLKKLGYKVAAPVLKRFGGILLLKNLEKPECSQVQKPTD